MHTTVLLVVVALVALAFDRLMLRLEASGHVYWRRSKRSGSFGTALLDMQSLLEPGKRIVVEERRREKKRSALSGDPPPGGAGADRRGGSPDDADAPTPR